MTVAVVVMMVMVPVVVVVSVLTRSRFKRWCRPMAGAHRCMNSSARSPSNKIKSVLDESRCEQRFEVLLDGFDATRKRSDQGTSNGPGDWPR